MRNKIVSRIHDLTATLIRQLSYCLQLGRARPSYPPSLPTRQLVLSACRGGRLTMRRPARLPRLSKRRQFLLLIRCQDLINLGHRRSADRRQLTHLAAF